MSIVTDFQTGVAEALKFGKLVRIKYYNVVEIGEGYDDDIRLTQSGADLWTSGVILPINNSRGSNDSVLLEQGKILYNDTKLYIDGRIDTSGTIKVGLGSPVENEYALLGEGIMNWEVNNTDILKKLYIRQLQTGSFIGEYN